MLKRQQKTLFVTKEEANATRRWFILDATGQTLGRFASEVAKILMGKHRPDYTPYVDTGDGVIIVNAGKIRVTGMKHARKIYRWYTGYMGGLREVPFETLLARNPTEPLRVAVQGMMPKSRLGRQQLRKLRIFEDTAHGMEAQQPISVEM